MTLIACFTCGSLDGCNAMNSSTSAFIALSLRCFGNFVLRMASMRFWRCSSSRFCLSRSISGAMRCSASGHVRICRPSSKMITPSAAPNRMGATSCIAKLRARSW